MRLPACLPIALTLATLACTDQPSILVDTAGVAYGWDCKQGACALELLAETPPPPPCPEVYTSIYTYTWGRFVEITSACAWPSGIWSSTAGEGRYLACDVDQDCPQLDFHESPNAYECSAGLCQNIDVEAYPRDELRRGAAVNLCIAELPRAQTWSIPAQIEDMLADHCGPEGSDLCPLPLPEPCWQPSSP
jgi:hypothetical protein